MIVSFNVNVQERDCIVLFKFNGEFDIYKLRWPKKKNFYVMLLWEKMWTDSTLMR